MNTNNSVSHVLLHIFCFIYFVFKIFFETQFIWLNSLHIDLCVLKRNSSSLVCRTAWSTRIVLDPNLCIKAKLLCKLVRHS